MIKRKKKCLCSLLSIRLTLRDQWEAKHTAVVALRLRFFVSAITSCSYNQTHTHTHTPPTSGRDSRVIVTTSTIRLSGTSQRFAAFTLDRFHNKYVFSISSEKYCVGGRAYFSHTAEISPMSGIQIEGYVHV